MKKFIITVITIVVLAIAFDTAYYHYGIYIDFTPNREVEVFAKTEGKNIYLDSGNGFEPFEIKGVDMGSGEPGYFSTDFNIDTQTYVRWFEQIQQMGANTVRIYTIQCDDFYNAFYEYNTHREQEGKQPLYLLHGVWINDYVQYSHLDAYSPEFMDTFILDCKTMVDIIHGKRKIQLGKKASSGSGTYNRDVSKWVIGYILGVEWESETVIYTNQKYEGKNSYEGKYMSAADNASPFEAMLARVGDEVIKHESSRYNSQRLIAFSNWCTTDPFKYPTATALFFNKLAYVDVEHLKLSKSFKSGHFASYHAYPYHPDYLNTVKKGETLKEAELTDFSGFKSTERRLAMTNAPSVNDYVTEQDYIDRNGNTNTYVAYLRALNKYHTIPVVISEFGVSTGRGIAQTEEGLGRNQGHTSEHQQGEALVMCYNDIKDAGCAGSCIFTWQDEWFKRTWNTMHAVDLSRTAYWSDYQTNEQYFGLLSFDPGKEKSICYVDGDVSEWTDDNIILNGQDNRLSFKYDEKFVYLMLEKKNFDFENQSVYIAFDVTPKSGSNYCQNFDISFERPADFVLKINGKDNTRLMVQERYEALRSTYAENVYQFDTYQIQNVPQKNSPLFKDINMILKTQTFEGSMRSVGETTVFPTGKLLYGNANPQSAHFNSLADFIVNGDYVEIKLPWQLLNFADPSRVAIHDDYYDGNYGIEYINISAMHIGVTDGNESIGMAKAELKGWGNSVTYHERLKSSYYIMQKLWNGGEAVK